MRVFLPFIAFMAFGCSAPPTLFEVRINPNVEHLDSVIAGLSEWEEHGTARFEPVIVTADGCSHQGCIYVEEVPPGSVNFDSITPASCRGTAGHTTGCTLIELTTWQSHVKISSGLGPETTRMVIMHEFGHATSDLPHTEAGTAMCAHFECMAKHVTWLDIVYFWRVRR